MVLESYMLVGFGVRLRFEDEGLAIIRASLVPAREFNSDANILKSNHEPSTAPVHYHPMSLCKLRPLRCQTPACTSLGALGLSKKVHWV